MPQADGAEMEYRVYVSTGYDSDRATPLVVALHGLGSGTMTMADESVDVKVTRRWVAKTKELGMNYEYIEIAAGSHSGVGRQNINKVFAFLAKYSR